MTAPEDKLAEQTIQTARLVLDPLLPTHAAALFTALQDSRLYTYIPDDPPITLTALAARYRRLARRRSPDGREVWLNWVANLRGADQPIGAFQATIPPDGPALLAYMIFAPFQRQGYACEGMKAIVARLATVYGVRQVAAEIDTRNAASIALVERLGFTRVATQRNADTFKGATSDEYRYERALRPPDARP